MKNQNLIQNACVNTLTAGLSKREANKVHATELYFDIIAYMSVLYKMGFDTAADNESLFVEMLNESGFRTLQGKEFTIMSYRLFMKRIPADVQESAKSILKGKY